MGTGPEPSPSLRSLCSELPSPLCTHTHIQVENREPDSKWKTRSKRAGKCISEKPESASRSQLSADPGSRAG